jgi:hypothetical protein
MSRRYESTGDMLRRLHERYPQQEGETDEEYDLRIQQIASEESDSGSDYDSDYVNNYDSDDETYGEQLRRLRAQNPQGEFLEGETDEQYEQRIRELAEEEDNGPMENLNEDNAEQAELIDRLRGENPQNPGESNIAYNTRIAGLALENEKPDIGFGECGICFENFQPNDVIIDAHPLDNNNRGSTHRFHKKCILPVCSNPKPECPLCRREINCEQIKKAGTGAEETGEVIMNRPRLQGGKRMRSKKRSKKGKKLITKKRKGKKKYSKKRKGGKKRRATKRKY